MILVDKSLTIYFCFLSLILVAFIANYAFIYKVYAQTNTQENQYSIVASFGSKCVLGKLSDIPADCNKNAPGAKLVGDGQFRFPTAIAINPSNNTVYVIDKGNFRIQEFTSNGTFITKWGTAGQNDEQFRNLEDIAVNQKTGNVYVADSINGVIKFTSNGTLITKDPIQGITAVDIDINPSKGNIYLANSGALLKNPTNTELGVILKRIEPQKWLAWSSPGIGSLAVNQKTGNVYIADEVNFQIQEFNMNHKLVTQWNVNTLPIISHSADVALDSFGNVYIAEDSSILKFTSNGTLITKIEPHPDGPQTSIPLIGGIAIDSKGNLYLSDSINNRIIILTPVAATQGGIHGDR